MKLKQFLFSAALLASMNAIGQSVPTHEMYVDFGITERTDMYLHWINGNREIISVMILIIKMKISSSLAYH